MQELLFWLLLYYIYKYELWRYGLGLDVPPKPPGLIGGALWRWLHLGVWMWIKGAILRLGVWIVEGHPRCGYHHSTWQPEWNQRWRWKARYCLVLELYCLVLATSRAASPLQDPSAMLPGLGTRRLGKLIATSESKGAEVMQVIPISFCRWKSGDPSR